MKNLVLILFICFFNISSFAKRVAPPEVTPIVHQGKEFSFRIEQGHCEQDEICGMQVFLISKNKASGKLNWERELYQKLFDPSLEIDVQTVFPRSMKMNKKKQVVVVDERGSTYTITSRTGDMVDPLKSIIYPAQR